MGFICRRHRGWINCLGVSPDFRHRGIGRRMMEAAEERLRALGCPKINLQVRTSNKEVIDFYKRVGYSIDDVLSMGKRLTPVGPGKSPDIYRESEGE